MAARRRARRRRVRRPAVEQLESRRLLAADWQSPFNRLDVNFDGQVTPRDALVVINKINGDGSGPVPAAPATPPPYFDTNGDGFIAPLDVLLIFNALNLDASPPVLSAGLASDTGPFGTTNNDSVTRESRITGTAADLTGITSLVARLDGGTATPVAVGLDGTFSYQPLLASDGSADGPHTVSFVATDGRGNASSPLAVAFEYDTTAPAAPTFELDPAFDSPPVGDGQTRFEVVALAGRAAPLAALRFAEGDSRHQADAQGDFAIRNVALSSGPNPLTVEVSDVAGNIAALQKTVTLVPDNDAMVLAEHSRFVTEASRVVELGQTAGSRTIRFEVDAGFDTADATGAVGDLLLVYLVDPAAPGKTLLDRGRSGTSLFTLGESGAEYAPGLVRYENSTVDIDVSSLGHLTQGKLVFQLINGDADTGSRAAIRSLASLVAPAGVPRVPFARQSALSSFADATDVGAWLESADLRPLVSNVRLDAATGDYRAELRVRNRGPATGRQIAVVFPDLPAGVQLVDPSGLDPLNRPYVNLHLAVPAGGLMADATTSGVELVVSNPALERFPLTPIVVHGPPNRAPVLGPIGPLTVMPGGYLDVPLTATDPDGDDVLFSLVAGDELPPGMLTGDGRLRFHPAPGDLGQYTFDVVASDGALEDRQSVSLAVVADAVTTTRVSGQVLNTAEEPLAGVPIGLGRVHTATGADGRFTIELPSFVAPAESFDIPVPVGDVHFDPSAVGDRKIPLHRAVYDPSTGDSVRNPRRHPNLISSFLDASMVYGSDASRASALGLGDGSGKLKTSAGNLLPLNNSTFFPGGPVENVNSSPRDPADLFVAGDVRANDNVALVALHTLLVREHNRKAGELAAADPALTGDQIYELARRWVGALVQHITYNEFLPALLGEGAIPDYAGYDPAVDPAISTLFSVAAFRIGHSLTPDEVLRLDAAGQSLAGGPLSLRDAFFNPDAVRNDGIEPYLRGLAAQQAQNVDTLVVDGLRNFLFGPPGAGGIDLVAVNTQRARDVGLPGYNQARRDLGLPAAGSFADVTSDPGLQFKLATVYGTVDRLDVWIGGLAEDHVPGALVGRLFHTILRDQWIRLRDGDRFWYENAQFTAPELQQIRATSLADVVVRNTAIAGMTGNVFTTAVPAPGGPAPGGNAAASAPAERRSFDGSGNNPADGSAGQAGTPLRIDYTPGYADGISQPGGGDRPGAREISNGVSAQSQSVPNGLGVTSMLTLWGQLIDHDVSFTPGGSDDTLKIFGDGLAGPDRYPFVAEKVALLLERDAYAGIDNVIPRPIYLPVLDVAGGTTINPSQDTMVEQEIAPGEMARVDVKAGTLEDRAGGMFDGVLSITEVPPERTPAALPPNLFPDIVVTVQPGDMVFTQPAPLTLPNRIGYAANTAMDLWSINPVTGVFDNVGQGRVTSDGQMIETTAGGIRNSSWHFFAPPPDDPGDPSRNPRNEKKNCLRCGGRAAGASDIELHSGAVIETHELVTYQSLGLDRGIVLTYDSLRADPRPIVHFGYTNVAGGSNRLLNALLKVSRGDFQFTEGAGFSSGLTCSRGNAVTFLGVAGHFWSIPGPSVDAALQVDLRAQPTGVYDYSLDTGIATFSCESLQAILGARGTRSTSSDRLAHVNTIDSPFGSGWGLQGFQGLVENPDGSVLLVDGDGSELVFDAGDTEGQFTAPAGDKSRLQRLGDGTYRRTFPDQTTYTFNAQLMLESIRDRNNNVIRYEYDAGGQLVKIVDPVGLETNFGYTSGKVASITDPGGRETRIEYDAHGNLVKITDPDGTSRTFEYDAGHRMIGEIDQRGLREQVFYGFHGRAERVVRKDGSEILVEPVQVQGLYPPESTGRTYRGAPPAIAAGPPQSAYMDGNGNVTRTLLDQGGQVVSRTDSAGPHATLARNDENQIVRRRNARGNLTLFRYDAMGNLIGVRDELSGGGNTLGSIAEPGERDVYEFLADAGDRLYFDAQITAFNAIDVTLEDPSGQLVFGEQSNIDFGPVTLTRSGMYQLQVIGRGDTTGDYGFRVLPVDELPVATPGELVQVVLLPGADAHLTTFLATAGQRLYLDYLTPPPGGGSATLYAPDNAPIAGSSLGNNLEIELPRSGRYTLAMERDNLAGDALQVDFRVVLAQTVSRPLEPGRPVRDQIASPGDVNEWTWTAAAGDTVYYDTLPPFNTLTTVELVSPGGRSVFSRSSSDNHIPVTLAETGTYRLRFDGISDSTGSFAFRLLNLADAEELMDGVTIDGRIVDGRAGVYRLDGAAGQRFEFDNLEADGAGAVWSLFGPGNLERNRTILQQDFTALLAADGEHHLVVTAPANGAASYRFQVFDRSEAPVAPAGFGTVRQGSLAAGQTESFPFTASAGMKVYFDNLQAGASSLVAELRDPDDALAFTIAVSRDLGPVVLERSGTYMLTVKGRFGGESGDFAFRLLDLTNDAAPIVPGAAVEGVLDPGLMTAAFELNGNVGRQFYYDALEHDFDPVTVRLVRPDGRTVWLKNTDENGPLFTLPGSGTYQVMVDAASAPAHDYGFRIVDATAATTILPDTLVSGTLAATPQANLYRFAGTADRTAYFDAVSFAPAIGGTWSVLGPGGQVVGSNSLGTDLIAHLPMDGTYTLVMDRDASGAAANYEFEMSVAPVTSVPLEFGKTMAGVLNAPLARAVHVFDGRAGQIIYYDAVESDGDQIFVQLESPSGDTLFGFDFARHDAGPVRLPMDGRYELSIYSADDATGDYEFQVVDFAAALPISLDTVVAGQLDPGLSARLYKVSLAAEQHIYAYTVSETPAGQARWMIFDGGGNDVASGPSSLDFETTVERSDTYTILISGSSAGQPIDFSYQIVTPDTNRQPLAFGQVVSGTISETGERDEYEFAGTAGQRLFFDGVRTGTTGLQARVIDPEGRDIAVINDIGGGLDHVPVTLRRTGSYRLRVDGLQRSTGDYEFRLLDVAQAPLATLDTEIAGALDPPAHAALYRIAAPAGTHLYLDMLSVSQPSTGSRIVYAADDERLSGWFLEADFESTVEGDGEWILVLGAGNSNTPIDYRFSVVTPETQSTPLVLGQPTSGTIGESGETDVYSFTAVAGQRVLLDAIHGDARIDAQLVDAFGHAVWTGASTLDRGPVTVPADGSYRVVLDGANDAQGSYTFRLVDIAAATPYALGSTLAGSLNPGRQSDVYTFAAAAGTQLRFDFISSSRTGGIWSLYAPNDRPVIEAGLDVDRDVVLPIAGTYVLVVGDATNNDPLDFEFKLTDETAPPVNSSGFGVVRSGAVGAGEEHTFVLEANAGTPVFFDSMDHNAHGLDVELLAPSGQTVFTGRASSEMGVFFLSETGTHSLKIRGRFGGSGSYRFRVLDLTTAPTIPLGTVVSHTLDQNWETDVFRIAPVPGLHVYYDSFKSDTEAPPMRLFGPGGFELFSSHPNVFTPPFSLPAADDHYIVLESADAAAAAHDFRVLDLAAAPVAVPGTTLQGTLDPTLEADVYRIAGKAGDRLFFNGLPASTSNGRYVLWKPDGTQLGVAFNFRNALETTLPGDGSYTLVIDDRFGNGPLDYAIQLVAPPTSSAPYSIGDVVAGTIALPGETDAFTFAAQAGDRLYFDSLDDNPISLRARLAAPSGHVLFDTYAYQESGLVTLVESGTYRLSIDGEGNTTGDYGFRVLDVAAAPELGLDTSTAGRLDPGLSTSLFRITSGTERRLFFDSLLAAVPGTSSRWNLYDPGDELAAWRPLGVDFDAELEHAGTYVLALAGAESGGPAAFDFQAVTLDPGRRTLSLAASAGERRFTYDPVFNQQTSTTDELGRTLWMEVDPANGNLLSTTTIIGGAGGGDDIVNAYTYGARGQLATHTDPLGRATRYAYDAAGRVVSITEAEGTSVEATRRFEYDAAGNTTALIDENGNRSEFEYDVMNRRVVVRDPLGNETRFAYDEAGFQMSITDARGNATQFEFNELGRMRLTRDPGGNTARFEYDDHGNLVTSTDALGNVTRHVYDARRRVVMTIDPDGGETEFRYDADDNRTAITDATGNTWQLAYDARNRLVAETDPRGLVRSTLYDPLNNAIATTDRLGRTIEFQYDVLNRQTAERWIGADGTVTNTLQSVFDLAGNLLSVEDSHGALAFSYDHRDRITTAGVQGPLGAPAVTLAYTYDPAGNITQVAEQIGGSAGATTARRYDAVNRVSRITQTGGVAEKRVDVEYQPDGRTAAIRRFADAAGTAPVLASTYAYDTLNRVTGIRHGEAAGPIESFGFQYDSASRVVGITELGRSRAYGYDDRNQLVSAAYSDAALPDESYAYDAAGNRIQSHRTSTAQFSAGNQLDANDRFTYQYDAEGNLLGETEKSTGRTRHYEYDHRNRLVAVRDRDASGVIDQRVEFRYDAFDRRIAKVVDDVITHFVYDGNDVLLDFVDADGAKAGQDPALARRYLHGPAIDQVLAEESPVGDVHWHLADHLGTVHALVDQTGALANRLTYDAFGNLISQTNASRSTRYAFTGREYDRELGRYYYRARYMDPATGRFLGQDPLAFPERDLSLYGYVDNNPIMNRDPDGEFKIGAVGFGLGVGYGITVTMSWKGVQFCGEGGVGIGGGFTVDPFADLGPDFFGFEAEAGFSTGLYGASAGFQAGEFTQQCGGTSQKITGEVKFNAGPLTGKIGPEGPGIETPFSFGHDEGNVDFKNGAKKLFKQKREFKSVIKGVVKYCKTF